MNTVESGSLCRKAGEAGGAGGRTAEVETVPGCGGIGGLGGGVLDCVTGIFCHASGCEEAEAAAARSRETVGDQILAGTVGQRVVTFALVAEATGEEGVALGGVRDAVAGE